MTGYVEEDCDRYSAKFFNIISMVFAAMLAKGEVKGTYLESSYHISCFFYDRRRVVFSPSWKCVH